MDITVFIIMGLLLIGLVFINVYAKPSRIDYFILFAVIIVLSLFSAHRSTVIPDTEPYIEYYDYLSIDMKYAGFFHYTNIMEIGFEFLARFCILLKLNYIAFFFLISLIQSLLFVCIARKISRRYLLLSYALFYSFYGFYFQFIILRAGISTLLFFYAIINCKGKYSRLFTFALSAIFHYSALFGIVLYYFFTIFTFKLTLKVIVFSVMLFIPIYLLSINKAVIDAIANILPAANSKMLLYSKIYYYTVNYGDTTYKIPFRLVFNILIYLWSLYIIDNYRIKRSKKLNIMIDITYAAIIIILLFGSVVPILRLSDFVMLSNVFVLVYIISKLKISRADSLWLYAKDKSGHKIIVYNKLSIMAVLTIYAVCNFVFIFRIMQNV